jgi:hypothetical protein
MWVSQGPLHPLKDLRCPLGLFACLFVAVGVGEEFVVAEEAHGVCFQVIQVRY